MDDAWIERVERCSAGGTCDDAVFHGHGRFLLFLISYLTLAVSISNLHMYWWRARIVLGNVHVACRHQFSGSITPRNHDFRIHVFLDRSSASGPVFDLTARSQCSCLKNMLRLYRMWHLIVAFSRSSLALHAVYRVCPGMDFSTTRNQLSKTTIGVHQRLV